MDVEWSKATFLL